MSPTLRISIISSIDSWMAKVISSVRISAMCCSESHRSTSSGDVSAEARLCAGTRPRRSSLSSDRRAQLPAESMSIQLSHPVTTNCELGGAARPNENDHVDFSSFASTNSKPQDA